MVMKMLSVSSVSYIQIERLRRGAQHPSALAILIPIYRVSQKNPKTIEITYVNI